MWLFLFFILKTSLPYWLHPPVVLGLNFTDPDNQLARVTIWFSTSKAVHCFEMKNLKTFTCKLKSRKIDKKFPRKFFSAPLLFKSEDEKVKFHTFFLPSPKSTLTSIQLRSLLWMCEYTINKKKESNFNEFSF